MLASQSVKPISYVKANASKLINEITENHQAIIVTQNGEAKAIIEDLKEYEKTQEVLAMLKLIAQGKKDIQSSQVKSAKQAFADIRKRISEAKANA